jgi:hypothetical protein
LLASFVVGEEIARQPDSFAIDIEKLANELDEELGHCRVRVCEDDPVPVPGSRRPVQHAAGDVAAA